MWYDKVDTQYIFKKQFTSDLCLFLYTKYNCCIVTT